MGVMGSDQNGVGAYMGLELPGSVVCFESGQRSTRAANRFAFVRSSPLWHGAARQDRVVGGCS